MCVLDFWWKKNSEYRGKRDILGVVKMPSRMFPSLRKPGDVRNKSFTFFGFPVEKRRLIGYSLITKHGHDLDLLPPPRSNSGKRKLLGFPTKNGSVNHVTKWGAPIQGIYITYATPGKPERFSSQANHWRSLSLTIPSKRSPAELPCNGDFGGLLGGGLKQFLFSPLPGEDSHFD